MTSQWTVQIPVFITISGDSDLMNDNQDVIQNNLKNMIETIIYESGTASARLEECLSDYNITFHEMDVITSEIITETTID